LLRFDLDIMTMLTDNKLMVFSDCVGVAVSGEDQVLTNWSKDFISTVELNMQSLLDELDSHEERSDPVTTYLTSSLDTSNLKEEIGRTEQQLKTLCADLESTTFVFNMPSINKYSFPQQTSTEAGNNIYIGDSGTELIDPESASASLLQFSAVKDKSMQSRKLSTARKPTNLENHEILSCRKKTGIIRYFDRTSRARKRRSPSGVERSAKNLRVSYETHRWCLYKSLLLLLKQDFGNLVPFIINNIILHHIIFCAGIINKELFNWNEISIPISFPKVGIGG
jgi:hypothetical protein